MTLFLIPTPIGNLRDITLRALDVLKSADLIVCEDTRHTQKLLDHFEIKTKPISFHDHSSAGKVQELCGQFEKAAAAVYMTDAGMPLISDPGFPLVREAIKRGIRVEALPGACAAITALAASGLSSESFLFYGFLPQKSGARKNALKKLSAFEPTLIFYESPFRVSKTLADIKEVLGDREAVSARELTKKFEEYTRGRVSDLIARFEKDEPKGEFVILVAGNGRKAVLSEK